MHSNRKREKKEFRRLVRKKKEKGLVSKISKSFKETVSRNEERGVVMVV